MIADFKGHHFVEDTKTNEAPSRHHCERCGMKAVLRPGCSRLEYRHSDLIQTRLCILSPSSTESQASAQMVRDEAKRIEIKWDRFPRTRAG